MSKSRIHAHQSQSRPLTAAGSMSKEEYVTPFWSSVKSALLQSITELCYSLNAGGLDYCFSFFLLLLVVSVDALSGTVVRSFCSL